ncbi:class V chitinase-like [Juglans regia]|uniref:Class V chitinase-like n=1 Tax=Juglans regia TaxID=51240 RepID=A0A6P9ES52_JUGRE|nr:class V chitinase-like [Juglans regia]
MAGVKAGYWILPASAGSRPFDGIINGGLIFTHVYLGFAQVNRSAFDDSDQSVILFPPGDVGKISETVHQNSNLKFLLSIGGEGRSDDIAYVVSDPNRHQRFIKDSIKLARKFNFDGLDLCWLYPQPLDSSQSLSNLLGQLLADWRHALDEEANETKLLLTAAVFHQRVINPGDADQFSFPIQALSDNLDWINVLAMDFYTPSNSHQQTGPVHAWRNPPNKDWCGSAGIDNWINGIGPNPVKIETNKLVLGLPFYGYEWTLAGKHENEFFAGADPAKATSLEFRTIQEQYINKYGSGRLVNNDAYGATYWHQEAIWIGFDDAHSIATKVGEAFTEYNLGGYVAWHLEADDYNWTLSKAASNAWANAINNPDTTITNTGNTTTTTTTTTNNNTGTTTTTTTTIAAAAAAGEGDINNTNTGTTTTTAASGEEDIDNDQQNSDQNTSTNFDADEVEAEPEESAPPEERGWKLLYDRKMVRPRRPADEPGDELPRGDGNYAMARALNRMTEFL